MTTSHERRTVDHMTTEANAFHVGDRALWRFGPTDVPVEVLEERGPIGYHGAVLVFVRLELTDSDPVEITVRESELRRDTSAA